MTVFDELYKSRFKGIPFSFRSESNDSGKKTISHEFLNSNERFTEELGEIPDKFSIQASISGTIQNRINFEKALKSSGMGILVHPIYGSIKVMATSYSVSSNDKVIGEFIFNINFEKSKEVIKPSPSTVGLAEINQNKIDTRDALGTAFENKYKIPSNPKNTISMATKINNFVSKVQTTISKVTNPIKENLAAYKRTTDAVTNGVWTIVQTAAGVKDAVNDVLTSVENLVETPSELTSFWKDLSNWNVQIGNIPGHISNYNGTDDSIYVYPVDTVSRQEEVNNSSIFDELVRISVDTGLAESYADMDFNTDDEINSAINDINYKYTEKIRNASSYIDKDSQMRTSKTTVSTLETLTSDRDFLIEFNKLRVNLKKILDEKLKNGWKLTNITQKNISSILLTSYRYFGSDDNKELLSYLNPELATHGFKGSMKMLTD